MMRRTFLQIRKWLSTESKLHVELKKLRIRNNRQSLQEVVFSDTTWAAIDEHLFVRSLTQWKLGDLESIFRLNHISVQHHPDRVKLILLLAASHAQIGHSEEARRYTKIALDWGCDKKLIGQILVSGLHNTLGYVANLAGDHKLEKQHIASAIQVGSLSSEARQFLEARFSYKKNQLFVKSNEEKLSLTVDKKKYFLNSNNCKNLEEISGEKNKNNFLTNTPVNKNNSTSLTVKFENIYQKKEWGHDQGWRFYSGSGSHDGSIVNPFVAAMTEYFGDIGKNMSAIDIGCGDFNVGKSIFGLFKHYTAIDIVPSLIRHNQDSYSDLNVEFLCLDATQDALPSADVVIVRQVLQHLSNDQASLILNNISGKFKYVVVVEHVPVGCSWKKNIDHPSGSKIRLEINSGIDIAESPFNFMYKEKFTIAESAEYGGLIRSNVYMC